MSTPSVCDRCGCTETTPCDLGHGTADFIPCAWANREQTLCTACVRPADRVPIISHEVKYCPTCGHELGRMMMTALQKVPNANTYTMCVYCTSPLRYGTGPFMESVDLAACTPEVRGEFERFKAAIDRAKAQGAR